MSELRDRQTVCEFRDTETDRQDRAWVQGHCLEPTGLKQHSEASNANTSRMVEEKRPDTRRLIPAAARMGEGRGVKRCWGKAPGLLMAPSPDLPHLLGPA